MKILADTDNYNESFYETWCHLGPQHLMRCIRPQNVQNVLTKLKVIHSSVIVNMIYAKKYNLKE